ncbi:MAG: hypothetical protein IPN29_21690 [Saprospiraceae bacterium]|nr:hypothetical protein [Saprospiraceae bacterium]
MEGRGIEFKNLVGYVAEVCPKEGVRQYKPDAKQILPRVLYGKIAKEVKENFRLTEDISVILAAIIMGFLAKKLYVGSSRNPLKKLMGELVLVGVTNYIAEHPEEVKKAGKAVINFIAKIIGAKPLEPSMS